MNRETWDTIVIGGGPAGSTAANLLAQAGQRVLVLEREAFPRFHVGESLIPYGNDVLRELGVWDTLASDGFMTKLGAEFTLGNAAGFQRFHFRKGLGERYGKTFQVERAKFDHVLLQEAEKRGASVLQRAKVETLSADDNGAEVNYEHAGKVHTARARWLVDGSGRTAVVGRALGLTKSDLGMPKRLAIFSHFEGVFRNEGEDSGHITVVRLENAWCWFIPLDATKTSVGLVQALADFKAQGTTVEESFERTMRQHTELRFRMKRARSLIPFRAESEYTFRHHRAAGSRWLLAGDAAGFVDPIFSSGVMVAVRSSALAAKAILHAEARGRALSPGEQRSYTRAVKKMTNAFLDMIRMFYDRHAFEVFMNPSPVLNLTKAALNLVGGNTDLPWHLQWRVWVFYLLCRCQRYVTIVPRLSFRDSPAVPSAEPAAVERVPV